jgi:hypothetical protein
MEYQKRPRSHERSQLWSVSAVDLLGGRRLEVGGVVSVVGAMSEVVALSVRDSLHDDHV